MANPPVKLADVDKICPPSNEEFGLMDFLNEELLLTLNPAFPLVSLNS